MLRNKLTPLSLLAALALVIGCDRSEPAPVVEDRGRVPDVTSDVEGDPYSAAQLERYREALPTLDILKAPAPSSDMQAQLGNPAEYPALAVPQVQAVNQQVENLVHTLEAITSLPPTIYNSDTLEFVWGPWDNDDSALEGDHVLAYIKDNGDSADFRYSYAFIRGIGNDMATYQPVIWGGAQPGEDDDTGAGVVLFDLEKNAEFELEHNPDVDDSLARGRFAIAFGKGAAEDDADTMVTMVVSTFRNFQPDGAAGGTLDMDQMYGHIDGSDGNTLDFVNIDVAANVTPDDAPDSDLEDIDLRLAFLNGGHGRAEAVASGGDLSSDDGDSVVLATECWDNLIARTYMNVTAEGAIAQDSPDGKITIGQEGDEALCGPIFENSLADLQIPSLDDMNPDHLTALQEVAENGM